MNYTPCFFTYGFRGKSVERLTLPKFPLPYTKININVKVSVSKGELRRRSGL